ncbi:hypothetical protein PLICRDRAFT_105811 [Plicaturopsis crispa FD-325 SS-3]|nr:hypothetical protein PLICRDRAFT_105811 [Plicaturopsis crispa FD-325 SS-3]
MAPAPLPTELVMAILEHAYYKTPGWKEPDARTLSAAALVCSSWADPAQRLLFHSIRFTLGTSADEQLVTGRDPDMALLEYNYNRLGAYVRELNVSLIGQKHALDLQPFLRILAACPRLHALTLRSSGVLDFTSTVMDGLRSISVCPRALHIAGADVQSLLLYRLLHVWPSIQILRLDSTEIVTPPPSYYAPPLYELAIRRTPIPSTLEWLLSASADTLRILEFRDQPGFRIRSLIAPLAPNLRSLRFVHFDVHAAAILRLCTNLEEFIVYHIPQVVRIEALPPSLVHFSFRNPSHSYSVTLAPIVDVIAPHEHLRVVTCDNDILGNESGSTLREVCASKNIELRAEQPPFWVYEDPIVVDQFPRRRSVANFVLMN